MARESDDPITAAVIATEKEIAGDAWGNEETDALDPTGDRSLEDQGEGLEGQHEAEDETDGEDADGESNADGEDGEGQVEPKPEPVAARPDAQQASRTEPEGRIPPGRHREVAERARAAEAERDTLKAALEKNAAESKAQIDLVMREIAALKTAPRTEAPRTVEPPKPEVIPDIFEDPKGFAEHLQKGFKAEISARDQQLANLRVENSMAIAHAFHKDTFEKAWSAVNALNVNDPDARSTVQRIYASPNPGEALVSWHKRETTRAEVGDDIVAYRERVAKETRESLLKDPEFRKQLIADMRGEAANGDDGRPRTTTRLPRSLATAQGSNIGAGRVDPDASDGSEQSIANAAWR